MITTEEIRELEDSCGISKDVLMETAGQQIAQTLKETFDLKNKRVLIVSYHGNNGGDGFVAARHLADTVEVDVLFVGDELKFKDEARRNFKKLGTIDAVQILTLESIDFSDYDYIVDAIFGTGVSREVKDPLSTLIKKLSATKAYKVSIDVPTGVDPNTGEKANVFFDPDLLITMHDYKKGLEDYKDKTVVVDIGIPQKE